MASRISWFASESGRKFLFYGSVSLGVGLFSAKFLPNTYFLESYQNVVQMYRLGTGVPVPKKVVDRFEQVLEDMKVPKSEKSLFKVFTVLGFDTFHAGTTSARTGSIIGIPRNYSYDSVNDVETSEILVNQKLVPWTTSEGQTLLNSVVLTPEAQKFAMATQISLCRTPLVYACSLYPPIAILFAYGSGRYLNRKLQLSAKKLVVKGSMYSMVCLFAIGLWAFANDYSTVMSELRADASACDLGPEYIRGGVELYSKILSRNVALRKLMGSEGEKIFTAFGNDQILIRQKHLPITVRKEYLEKRSKELLAS